jgi:ribonuclease J
MSNYPPDRVVILSTGAQGEEFAALMRMANKQHKNLKLQSAIPSFFIIYYSWQ